MIRSIALSAFAAASLAGSAMGFVASSAGPVNSNGALGDAGNGFFTATYSGPSTIFSALNITGTLNDGGVGTFVSEALWNVRNTAFAGTGASFQSDVTSSTFTAPVSINTNFTPVIWANTGDTFRFEAFESFNDSGVDANWTNTSFTFSGGPSILNGGTYAPGTFSFSTVGSDFDTELGLYTAAGIRIADDDDAGGSGTSLLSGQTLAAGTYYLVVSGYNTGFADGLVAPGSAAGDYILNVNGSPIGSGSTTSFGVVVYSITIPAPGAAAVLGLGGLIAMRRRRA